MFQLVDLCAGFCVFYRVNNTELIILTASAVTLLVVLIAYFKLNAFLGLMFTALGFGLVAGMSTKDVADSFTGGMGKTLGGIAGILGLGTMLGGLLAASGAAEVLSRSLMRAFGPKNVHWCLMILALAVGFTTWFAVGLVMLLPILLSLAHTSKYPFVKLALPLLAVLSIMHGVMPPHPGPLVAIEALNADLGMVMIWALIAAIPTAAVAGPIFANWVTTRVKVDIPEPMVTSTYDSNRPLPSLWSTVSTLVLPILLILTQTIADLRGIDKESTLYQIAAFIGNPNVALGVAVIYAVFAFGFKMKDAMSIAEKSLAPIAMTILLVGAGGGFNRVLSDTGAANAIGEIAASFNLSPMLFGWLCAALIRVATGSASVAIISACGLVAPYALDYPDLNLELLVVCIGSGSLFLSHVNDSGFWIVKETLGMTVSQTFKTWTVVETLIGISGLLVTWGLDRIF